MKKNISAIALVFAGMTLSNAAVYIDFYIPGSSQNKGTDVYGAHVWTQSNAYNVGSDQLSKDGAYVLNDSNGTKVQLNAAKITYGTTQTASPIFTENQSDASKHQYLTSLPTGADAFFDSNRSEVWEDGISGVTAGAMKVEFVLEANKTYTVALLGGKANSGFGKGTPNFNGLYLEKGNGEKVTGTAVYDGVENTGGSFVDGVFTGENGKHLASHTQLVYWTFTTGNDAETVKLYSANGTYNAISIESVAIPEPSAFGLLAGLGALAFIASRRRRSRKVA